MRFLSDTDFDARVYVGTELSRNILYSVVTAVATLSADSYSADIKRYIVVNNNYMVRGNLIKCRRIAHGVAGQVHHGLRLQEKCSDIDI